MSAFVALLRGVNVGKAKRVPMAEFRQMLTGLGLTQVATLLNSGNAIFHAGKGSSARLAKDIQTAMTCTFGFEVAVVVKSAAELEAIIAQNPIEPGPAEHSRLLVGFVQAPEGLPGLAPIAELAIPPDQFVLGRHAAYLYCPAGILESKAWAALVGKAGRSATTRNWATVLKLKTMLSA